MITKLATISIDEETGEFYADVEDEPVMISKSLDILFSMLKNALRGK